MEVDTNNDNISFVECKIYGRNMVDDKGENFEQTISGKTTIWMHSSGNQTEWILLLGCYKLRTLNDLHFTDNTATFVLSSSSQLQECITSCYTLDHTRRYFGLQDNMCFCYENNDVTVDSDCVAHKCKGGSESFCGSTNESVVIYYRGEFVNKYEERICSGLAENVKTSNNKDKSCQDDLFYLCTAHEELTNCSCHKQVMWFENRRNSRNMCVSTSNDKAIPPMLSKEGDRMYPEGQFTCEIFNVMNLKSTEIASSCITAAYFVNFTTVGNNWNTRHFLECSIPGNIKFTTPSTEHYNDNFNCSLKNCVIYIVIGIAVIVTLVVCILAIVCNRRKKIQVANKEVATEEIPLNTIRTFDSMEQPNAEMVEITNIIYSTAKPNVESIETSDHLYSMANPLKQTIEICDKVSSIEQHSTADIEYSNNVHRILQPITGITEISGNVDTTVHPNTGTMYTTENNENQYNILDHTLLKTRVDNGNGNENAVYDQIKPSVIPTDKFAGSVYDSVAAVNNMLDKLKK